MARAGEQNRFNLRRLLAALQLVFTLGAFAFVALRWDLLELLDNMRKLDAAGWGVAFALSAAQLVLLVLRWRLVLDGMGILPPMRALMTGVLMERFVNQFLPSTLGGDAARIGYLIGDGVNKNAAAVSVFFDRCLGILALFLLSAAALPFVWDSLGASRVRWPVGVVLATGLVSLGALVVVPRRRLHAITSLFGRTPARALGVLAEHAHELFRTRAFGLNALLVSVVIQASFSVLFVAVGAAIAPELSAVVLALFAPILMLTSLIPVSIGGWGVREGAAILLFATVNVSAVDALGISVLFGIVQLATGLISGLLAGWLSWSRTGAQRGATLPKGTPLDGSATRPSHGEVAPDR